MFNDDGGRRYYSNPSEILKKFDIKDGMLLPGEKKGQSNLEKKSMNVYSRGMGIGSKSGSDRIKCTTI